MNAIMKFIPIKLALFIFLICAVITFLFAFHGYPLLGVDSVCFLPTSYFINHYHQLVNPLYDAGIDTLHHKFIFYPPLFPYVISLITHVMPGYFTDIFFALT